MPIHDRETDMNRTPRTVLPSYLFAPALFAAAVLATASAVSAEKSFTVPAWGEARSATVRYADLDLTTPAGAERLERRIEFAIAKVCALPDGEQLAQRARVAECRAEARRQADAQAEPLLRSAQSLARRD